MLHGTPHADYPNSPRVNTRCKETGPRNVTLILDWTSENSVSYNVSVVPQVLISFTASLSVQLTVLYNVLYNVSVVSTLCGQNSATTSIGLKYGEHAINGYNMHAY